MQFLRGPWGPRGAPIGIPWVGPWGPMGPPGGPVEGQDFALGGTSIQNGGSGLRFGGVRASFWNHFDGLGGFWLPRASWEFCLAALGRFRPRCLQLDSQDGSMLEPNRYKHRCQHRCLSRSIFDAMLVDFGKKTGGKLAPKLIKDRCEFRKTYFWKIVFFSWGKAMVWRVQGVQVGSKNRSNIDQKMKST